MNPGATTGSAPGGGPGGDSPPGPPSGLLVSADCVLPRTLNQPVAGALVAKCEAAMLVANRTVKQKKVETGGQAWYEFGGPPHYYVETRDGNRYYIRGTDVWGNIQGQTKGWVKGDRTSADPIVNNVGTMGEMIAKTFDPNTLLAAGWGQCPEYLTADAKGADGASYRIDCPKPYAIAGGLTVSAQTIWFDSSYRGIRNMTTASIGGVTATDTGVLYDWGKPQDWAALEQEIGI